MISIKTSLPNINSEVEMTERLNTTASLMGHIQPPQGSMEAMEIQSSSNNMKELSLVQEEEYDDSKFDSKMEEKKSTSCKSALKTKSLNNDQNLDILKKSVSSSTYVDYKYENKQPENQENPENPDNESHFSPLVVIHNKNDDDDEDDSVDLDEENHAMKLRDEPSYKKHKRLFFPDDSFREKWEMVLAIMILYSCLWVPYYMAFSDDNNQNVITLVIDGVSDIVFFIDLLINFNSAFYNEADILVVKRSKIVKEYMKLWFWLDAVSAIPFSFIIEYQNTDKNLKFQKLIKLTRLIRILKMIKERNRLLKYLNKILRFSSGRAESLLGPIVIMACFCHISACFYYMICLAEDNPTNWISYYQDKDNNEKYLTAFYWVTQTVVTTGYGDIPCVTAYEQMFSIAIMFIGVLVYSFCVGSLSNFLINLDEQNEAFNDRLVTLYSMKHYYNLDFFFCKRIERFLRFGKKTIIQEQQKSFLLELPKNLKIELSSIIYKNYIDGIEFFKNKPKRFLAFICPYLKTIKISKDDFVFDEGDRANEIYFIKTGRIAMVIKKYNNFKVMKILQGNYFGDVDSLFNKVRTYTCIADLDCELLCMNKDDFMKVFFEEFKEIGADLYKTAVDRRAKMKEAFDKALKHCESRKRISLRRKTSTKFEELEPLSENQYYRSSSIIDKQESDRDQSHSNESLSAENQTKDGTKPLIKLQRVENESPSLSEKTENSETKGNLIEKEMEFKSRIKGFEEKLDHLESFINDFLENLNESNLSSDGDENVNENSINGLHVNHILQMNSHLETLSDGGRKNKQRNLLRNQEKLPKNSHFSKKKSNET